MGNTRAQEPALDGLRGLASLIVVFRHAFNAMVLPPAWRMDLAQSPVALLLNAQGAVQLFFVLSGWVLAGSLERSAERFPWPQFFVRRVFRIHPPYVVAVLVALGVALLPDVPNAPTPHPNATVPEPAALAAYLSFPAQAGNLLPIGWTLRIEMIFSFALPLLLVAARPARGLLLLAACAAVVFASSYDTPRYALDFALGIVAYRERAALAAALHRIGAAGRGALLAAGILLWISPLLLWPRLVHGYLIAGWEPREIALMGLGSAVIVVCALEMQTLQRWLSTRPCRFLGRISYSLYLLHWSALSLLAPWLVDRTAGGNVALLVAVTLLSIAASIPCFRWIERPSIALGNRVSRALARRLGAAPIQSLAGQAGS